MSQFLLWQAKKASKGEKRHSMPMSGKPTKLCKWCNESGHFPYRCKLNPKKPKKIKQRGKHSFKWQDTRQEWIDSNPPNHQGLWACELRISPQCIGMMDIDQLTIDHTIARSSDPKLRYTQSNLMPACVFCNGFKGSKKL